MMFALIFALTASPAPERQFQCVTQIDGGVRHFSFAFADNGGRIGKVKLVETDRVFTPGNAVATFSTVSGVTEIPKQRPGTWSGVAEGQVLRFAIKARDGTATFSLTPDAATPGSFALEWSAERTDPKWGGSETASGTGTCTEQTPGKPA